MNRDNRLAIFIIIGLGAIVFFGSFVNRYVLQSQAAESKANVQMTVDENGILSVVVQPESGSDTVSGLHAAIDVTDGVIATWSDCKAIDPNDTPDTEILINSAGANSEVGCVVKEDDADLPSGLVVVGAVQCDGTTPAQITFNAQKSSASGPVENGEYVFNAVQNLTYDCGGGGGEPTPTPVTDVSAVFDPTTCRGNVGESCDYSLTVRSNDQSKKISGYYVKLTYDKNIVTGKSIDGPSSGSGSSLFGVFPFATATPVPATPTPAANIVPTNPPGRTRPTAVPPTATPTPANFTNPQLPACQTNQDCYAYCSGLPGVPNQQKCLQHIFCNQTTNLCEFSSTPNPGAPTPGGPNPTTGQPNPTSGQPTPTGGVNPTPDPRTPVAPGCTVVSKNVDDDAGIMELLYTCNQAATELGTSYTNTLKFEGKSNGQGSVTISDIQVVGPQGAGGLYSVSKGTGEYIIGAGGSGNLEVNLKLRLQGIVKKPSRTDALTCKIGLGDGGLNETIFQSGEFKADDNGHFDGTVRFEAPARDDYKLITKCEYHSARKICAENASEDVGGEYSCDKGTIELNDGRNELNVTKVFQLVCDINQDTVCNGADLALMRNNIGKDDDESLKATDVNLDGTNNAVDFSLLIGPFVRADAQ